MTTTRAPGRPRRESNLPSGDGVDTSALLRSGITYRTARARAENARLDLNREMETALLAGVHYLEVARVARVSKKMSWRILKDLEARGAIRYFGADQV
jgi:hypothetical protein